MDKIYVDYENTDILDMPIGEECIECALVGVSDELFEERSKEIIGTEKPKKKEYPISVYVGSEEGTVPHVHIFLKKFNGSEYQWKTEAVLIMLLANAYFDHNEGNRFFDDRKQLDAVIRIFKTRREDGMTGWEYACKRWNAHNPDYRIPDEIVEEGMPDYEWEPPKYDVYKKMRKKK